VATLSNASKNQHSAGRYFAFSANVINQLKNIPSLTNSSEKNQDQNSKAVEKSLCSSGCSNNNLTTTTTTAQNNLNNKNAFSENWDSLIYPKRLSDNQIILADRYLTAINPEQRQLVLDELQGRLESEQKGMKPVYDELRFLHSLCKAAQKGEFIPNLAIKVAEARVQRQPLQAPDAVQREVPSAKGKQRAREFGSRQLAQLKQSFQIEKNS
jgi:hypothetical protein